ncbi:hypothetical protein S40285_10082 [Stachybotrys chlorohalonatus IBT 40285]|uniref:Uncharacterized protein n=1 Tax=Stachybotrys chlorohalonatus (strain IBT 40285) TaxID=1283841 RepID=A0A084QGX0_STAC4|nr:hypothetical protein S40285_10082 [Stachybotrys chlorohalonata IBT 40285]
MRATPQSSTALVPFRTPLQAAACCGLRAFHYPLTLASFAKQKIHCPIPGYITVARHLFLLQLPTPHVESRLRPPEATLFLFCCLRPSAFALTLPLPSVYRLLCRSRAATTQSFITCRPAGPAAASWVFPVLIYSAAPTLGTSPRALLHITISTSFLRD